MDSVLSGVLFLAAGLILNEIIYHISIQLFIVLGWCAALILIAIGGSILIYNILPFDK